MPIGMVGRVSRKMIVFRRGGYPQHEGADRLDVKIKNHGLGQYGAEPHYSTLPFWQLSALKG